MDDVIKKAEYCLNCKNKPCVTGCPLGNNIPEFIKYIKDNNIEGAYKELSKTTVLSSICGRVCPHMDQCMGKCVRGIKQIPVDIGNLEAFVGDMALKYGYRMSELNKDINNKKIAVIGSGPSGLTCAAFLARRGGNVTIYEKRDKLGGILRYGIPDFRLDKKMLDNVINDILLLGIDLKTNKCLGKDFCLEDTINYYDAIFLSFGANISRKMGIHGENLNGVFGANFLLEDNSHPNYKGKTVIVVGGGNVAIDVARVIKRFGANNVKIVYRRTEDEMPAEKREIEDAKTEGVEFIFKTNILKIVGDKRVEKVECVKTELLKKDECKRMVPVNIENSNFYMECDYVIMAIGSKADENITNMLDLEKNEKGFIKVDNNYRTSNNKIFAGGDLIGQKETVAWAAYSGRIAAEKIVQQIKNNKKM